MAARTWGITSLPRNMRPLCLTPGMSSTGGISCREQVQELMTDCSMLLFRCFWTHGSHVMTVAAAVQANFCLCSSGQGECLLPYSSGGIQCTCGRGSCLANFHGPSLLPHNTWTLPDLVHWVCRHRVIIDLKGEMLVRPSPLELQVSQLALLKCLHSWTQTIALLCISLQWQDAETG